METPRSIGSLSADNMLKALTAVNIETLKEFQDVHLISEIYGFLILEESDPGSTPSHLIDDRDKILLINAWMKTTTSDISLEDVSRLSGTIIAQDRYEEELLEIKSFQKSAEKKQDFDIENTFETEERIADIEERKTYIEEYLDLKLSPKDSNLNYVSQFFVNKIDEGFDLLQLNAFLKELFSAYDPSFWNSFGCWRV